MTEKTIKKKISVTKPKSKAKSTQSKPEFLPGFSIAGRIQHDNIDTVLDNVLNSPQAKQAWLTEAKDNFKKYNVYPFVQTYEKYFELSKPTLRNKVIYAWLFVLKPLVLKLKNRLTSNKSKRKTK